MTLTSTSPISRSNENPTITMVLGLLVWKDKSSKILLNWLISHCFFWGLPGITLPLVPVTRQSGHRGLVKLNFITIQTQEILPCMLNTYRVEQLNQDALLGGCSNAPLGSRSATRGIPYSICYSLWVPYPRYFTSPQVLPLKLGWTVLEEISQLDV